MPGGLRVNRIGVGRWVVWLMSVALLLYFASLPERTRLLPAEIHVIDGDTIAVGGQRYRLTGYDTPETYQARCDREKALGDRATKRLRTLVRSRRPVELLVARGRDKFGRRLARLLVGSRDVGDILVAEGLARRFDAGQREGWC